MPVRSPVDWFFQDPWQELTRWSDQGMLSIDMRETDDTYVIEAEMPGVKPEDIEGTLAGNSLLIRGQYKKRPVKKENEAEGEGGRYILKERETATYARAITLPGAVEADKITSSYENGELKITLPKAAETRARRIPIKAGAGRGK